ncbi:unnamed protein product [Pleuronectes platessa]|uniref:Uncharacterized protein n=1 Tax=Pleuronectes platessa TaxID=8262 RepID=A0A9N7UIN3_PLEPL|nr:unnamed protein product [Pleuronectes platessa]
MRVPRGRSTERGSEPSLNRTSDALQLPTEWERADRGRGDEVAQGGSVTGSPQASRLERGPFQDRWAPRLLRTQNTTSLFHRPPPIDCPHPVRVDVTRVPELIVFHSNPCASVLGMSHLSVSSPLSAPPSSQPLPEEPAAL